MIDSINLGKYIYSTLTSSNDLKAIVGTRIYPLVADNDVKFPFIVYKRNSLESNGCKDGYYKDQAEYEINIITERYAQGIEIANLVRELLERQQAIYNEMEISDTVLMFATEDYNDGFVQRLQFRMNILKY